MSVKDSQKKGDEKSTRTMRRMLPVRDYEGVMFLVAVMRSRVRLWA